MITTIKESYSDSDDRISSEYTLLHSFFSTFPYRWDEFFRYSTSFDLVDKLIVESFFVATHIFDSDHCMTELSTSSCLSLEDTFTFSSSLDCFSECYLWFSTGYFYFVFSLESIHDDIEVEFSHTSDDSLT